MPLSVAQLRKAQTSNEVLAFLLNTLESLGFITDSWQDGSTQRNILTAVSDTYAAGTGVIAQLVENILVNPSGEWLDLIGVFWFRLPRIEAIPAQRDILFVSAPSAPPHTIAYGSILATPGMRFLYLGADYALAPGASVTLPCIAEFGGVAGNAPSNASLVTQVPPYSGVTVSFVGAPTVNGVERELDSRYLTRLNLRWSDLTYSVGLRAYELWALTAAPSVRRVRAINNYPTPNEVRVILDIGDGSEIAAVAAFVVGKHPPNDNVTVSARNVVTVAIKARPRVLAGTTVAQVQAALQSVLDAMPIGGWPIAGASAGRLLREKLSEVLLCQNGCQSAGIELPATDVILGATDIVEGTFDIELELAV